MADVHGKTIPPSFVAILLAIVLIRQWLHPSKLDYLGANKDFDHTQVNSSGASKRSVQQAYERAMSYHRKVIQSNNTEDSDEFSSSTTM
jgi:hypothetical protein